MYLEKIGKWRWRESNLSAKRLKVSENSLTGFGVTPYITPDFFSCEIILHLGPAKFCLHQPGINHQLSRASNI